MSEKDIITSPQPIAEPSGKPVRTASDRLLKILTDNPDQYADILEAYSQAPEVPGETIINATPYTGDTGEIEEIKGPVPAHLESLTRPWRRGNEIVLRRPQQHEVIYVGPKHPTATTFPSQISSQPAEDLTFQGGESSVSQYDAELANNPFLQGTPPIIKKAA